MSNNEVGLFKKKTGGEHGAFHGAYVDDLLLYVRETYGDEIEYPWKDMDAAVIRSHVTKKWYAVFMKILPAKIGLGGQKHIRVMNLHGTAEEVAALVDGKKCFPGYHMNRKYWISVALDERLSDDDAKALIEESGRLELPGRPLIYGTTPNFLRCFSLSSLEELPKPPEKPAEKTAW